MKIAKSAALALLLCSCTSVQTRTKGDLYIHKEDGRKPDLYGYESLESHDAGSLIGLCWLTGWIYGGACWAYLFEPDDNKKRKAVNAAHDDAQTIGRCAEMRDIRVERASWSFAPKELRISTPNGRKLSHLEVMSLCDSQKTENSVTTPQS